MRPGRLILPARLRPLSPARAARGPVVVLSDLYDPRGFEPGLELLRYHGYEPRLVQIQALQEMEPGLAGDVELFDVETQAVRRVTITEQMNAAITASCCRSFRIPSA